MRCSGPSYRRPMPGRIAYSTLVSRSAEHSALRAVNSSPRRRMIVAPTCPVPSSSSCLLGVCVALTPWSTPRPDRPGHRRHDLCPDVSSKAMAFPYTLPFRFTGRPFETGNTIGRGASPTGQRDVQLRGLVGSRWSEGTSLRRRRCWRWCQGPAGLRRRRSG